MKHLKVTTGILALAFLALTITSCKKNKKDKDTDHEPQTEIKSEMHHHEDSDDHDKATKTEAREIETSTQKNGETSPIIDAYLQIKNSLVADNKENAAKGGTTLLTALSKFDMSSLKGETHNEYMEILESAKEHAEHIVKSPLDHQREHFESLSTDINDLITLLGTDKTLYQDYCPMKKASWLSETKDVKNPYYGSKMLTCGIVKKQIN